MGAMQVTLSDAEEVRVQGPHKKHPDGYCLRHTIRIDGKELLDGHIESDSYAAAGHPPRHPLWIGMFAYGDGYRVAKVSLDRDAVARAVVRRYERHLAGQAAERLQRRMDEGDETYLDNVIEVLKGLSSHREHTEEEVS